MAALKKLILTPYFGPFPPWFDLFIADFNQTMKPQGYEWGLDTDLPAFKKRVKDILGIEYSGVRGSGKVWDLRCALGLLYEEELRGYDYWGHMDFDLVFGDMSKFMSDSTLSEIDVYSTHNEYVCGAFSLYRNHKKVNELFKHTPTWAENMSGVEPSGWVEQEFSRILERSSLRYRFDIKPQGDPFTDSPVLNKSGNQLFQRIDLSEKTASWREVGLFHFRRSKHKGYPL